MNGIFDEDHTCICGTDDPEAERLRDLVSGGMGQWRASRMLWGPSVEEVA
jgi:hypothetical protein